MSARQVSIDELIAVWLMREKETILTLAKQYGLLVRLRISEQNILTIVNEPNYSSVYENRIREMLLQFYRSPLLPLLRDGVWYEETMSEDEFQNLMVIHDKNWITLSDNTGSLATVATNVSKAHYQSKEPEINGMMRTIKNILGSKIDTRLFIIKSKQSESMTILEGNKNAVAIYIRHFIEKEIFQPFKFFMGYLGSKSFWEW